MNKRSGGFKRLPIFSMTSERSKVIGRRTEKEKDGRES